MTALTPSGDNTLLGQDVATRKIGRLERFLGPENYRILTGLLKPCLDRWFDPDRFLHFHRHCCPGHYAASHSQ